MAAPNRLRLGLAMRLALRELRGGLSGFYIFLACVALGTGAIAGVNSVSQMMTGSIVGRPHHSGRRCPLRKRKPGYRRRGTQLH
jgi:predicted lysophospholipase L1 biosynthesis ABC-type transport system permease subunit